MERSGVKQSHQNNPIPRKKNISHRFFLFCIFYLLLIFLLPTSSFLLLLLSSSCFFVLFVVKFSPRKAAQPQRKKRKNLSLRTERSGVKQSHQDNPIPRRRKKSATDLHRRNTDFFLFCILYFLLIFLFPTSNPVPLLRS